MWYMFADETNMTATSGKFFIYGGVAFSSRNSEIIHQKIESIRKYFNFKPSDSLKFNSVERPKHILPKTHLYIKNVVLQLLNNTNTKLFYSLILHDIASNPNIAREYEINRISLNFNSYLHSLRDRGLIFIDCFKDRNFNKILREKFSKGITWQSNSKTRLGNVIGYFAATNGSSHFSSVVDIAIGAFRFVVDNYEDRKQQTTCSTILNLLRPLTLPQYSIFFSPKTVRKTIHRIKYQKLRNYFRTEGILTIN